MYMKKVIIFGGGSGLSQLLKGLKLFPKSNTPTYSVPDSMFSLYTIVAFFNNKNQKFYLYRYPSNTTALHFHKFFKQPGVHGIFEFLYNKALKNGCRFISGEFDECGNWVCSEIDMYEYANALYESEVLR